MRKHAIIAAVALCALGGSLSAVNAAGPAETTAEAVALPFVDGSNGADLPRFQPSSEIGTEASITFVAPAREALEKIGDGQASWYGAQFAGRPTASGERFNPSELTAAHRTLPFGSKVRVTHASSGRSVVVRINDRGPFHGNRVIDLSQAAAEEIGIRSAGSGRVELALLSS
jgi:rare lipoprotein A